MKNILIWFALLVLCFNAASSSAQEKIEEKLDGIQKTLEKQNAEWKPSDKIALGALIVTAISLAINFIQFSKSQKNQKETKEKELLFDSLEWFEGKTQPRSIGISVIEAYFDDYKNKDLGRVWASVLTNQAIHILTQVKDEDKIKRRTSGTEFNNLERIINLLSKLDLSDEQKEIVKKGLNKANLTNSVSSETGIILERAVRDEYLGKIT